MSFLHTPHSQGACIHWASVTKEQKGMANDDTSVASTCSGGKKAGVFKRSASEQTFTHLQHMERNYSKLGSGGSSPRIKEPSKPLGTIKVASLNSINLEDSHEKNNDAQFVGRRDVSNPGTLKEKRIVSKRGSIRGFKNRVRAGIATFIDQNGYTVGCLLLSLFPLSLRVKSVPQVCFIVKKL